MNTRVEYLYRDGSNYKRWAAVVFAGECDASLTRRLFAALDREEFFIAHQVRLPEVFFDDRALYADDHCWHEIGNVTTTSAPADDLLQRTIEEFVIEVERASHDGWTTFDRWSRQNDFPDRKGFASSGDGQTLFRVAENGFDLRACYAGEPFEEVVDSGAVFEVGEKGLNRNSRVAENPGAADGFGVSFDRRAGAPIKHAKG